MKAMRVVEEVKLSCHLEVKMVMAMVKLVMA